MIFYAARCSTSSILTSVPCPVSVSRTGQSAGPWRRRCRPWRHRWRAASTSPWRLRRHASAAGPWRWWRRGSSGTGRPWRHAAETRRAGKRWFWQARVSAFGDKGALQCRQRYVFYVTHRYLLNGSVTTTPAPGGGNGALQVVLHNAIGIGTQAWVWKATTQSHGLLARAVLLVCVRTGVLRCSSEKRGRVWQVAEATKARICMRLHVRAFPVYARMLVSARTR